MNPEGAACEQNVAIADGRGCNQGRTAWTRWANVERTISAAREGQRNVRVRLVLPEVRRSVAPQRHSLSFVGLGKFGANAKYGAESCVCPFWHPSIPGLPPL